MSEGDSGSGSGSGRADGGTGNQSSGDNDVVESSSTNEEGLPHVSSNRLQSAISQLRYMYMYVHIQIRLYRW